jgi:hypothetical protein
MKLTAIILIFISFQCLSQTYTYFDTFDKNEIYDNSLMEWRVDSIVWNVFFQKTSGLILFQDTLSKDWFSFKIVDEGSTDSKEYNYSYRCIDNVNREAYIYFYKDGEYSIIKVEYPMFTLRYKRLLR